MLRIGVLAFYLHLYIVFYVILFFLYIGYMWVPDLYTLSRSMEILIQILYIICLVFFECEKNE